MYQMLHDPKIPIESPGLLLSENKMKHCRELYLMDDSNKDIFFMVKNYLLVMSQLDLLDYFQ